MIKGKQWSIFKSYLCTSRLESLSSSFHCSSQVRGLQRFLLLNHFHSWFTKYECRFLPDGDCDEPSIRVRRRLQRQRAGVRRKHDNFGWENICQHWSHHTVHHVSTINLILISLRPFMTVSQIVVSVPCSWEKEIPNRATHVWISHFRNTELKPLYDWQSRKGLSRANKSYWDNLWAINS